MNQNKPPVAPQGTVEGETDADYVKAGEAVLAKHDHRWESHSDYVKGLIVRDVAYYRDLLVHAFAYSIGLERKLAESVAPPSVAMQRNSVLMEALKAVENERLDEHGELCASSDAASVYKEDNGDEAYSRAIRDAENAIKLLMSKPPIEVPPPSGVELAKQLLRVNLFTNMTPRNRQLLDEEVLAALDALPVAVSGEGSGVPALDPDMEAGKAVLAKHDREWDRHSDYMKSLVVRDVEYYRDMLVGAFAYSSDLQRQLRAALSSHLQGWISFQQEWPPLRETVEVYFPEPELALCRRELEELADDDMSEPENILWDIVCDQERITAGAIWRKHTPPDTKGGTR